ncbi:MAG TPA: substrate-binding domain-containing protein [Candidatus Bathyarchaeia archaeon]|nr:substrate-binding domain-containing protein [Candidatus Bathyarchaeia archaeon]
MYPHRYIFKNALFLSLLLLSMITGACGSPTSRLSDSSVPAVQPGQHDDQISYTFGIVYPMAHPFYEMITQVAEESARSEQIRLIVKAPDEANIEQQIWMVETMIKQKVDGIAIDPIDPEALAPVINKAMDNGIPVICFESDSPDSKRVAFIGTDNRKAGELMGKSIEKQLGGRGMVLVESGLSSMLSVKERLDGMLMYLEEHTQVQVLEVRYNEGKDSRALAELENMIDQHPHFDAFVAMDFVSGSASVLVWKAKGLTRYAITFGMTPEMKEAMVNGQLSTVISQNEQEWGSMIIDSLMKASTGADLAPFLETGVTEVSDPNEFHK